MNVTKTCLFLPISTPNYCPPKIGIFQSTRLRVRPYQRSLVLDRVEFLKTRINHAENGTITNNMSETHRRSRRSAIPLYIV